MPAKSRRTLPGRQVLRGMHTRSTAHRPPRPRRKGGDPMITCPTCHGKDGLHGLDCGFTSVRPHMTHHDDCGCLTARYQARIAALEAENKALYERRLPCREAEIAQKRYENAEAEVSRAWGERRAEPLPEEVAGVQHATPVSV